MTDRIFYVYQLRVDDEALPFYIGKGFGRRAYHHLLPGNLKVDDTHKANKIRKAQRNEKLVRVEFLRENIKENQAHRLEKYWIAKVGRSDLGLGPLTNKTNGGEGVSGLIISEETRLRLSISHKGKKHTEEQKAKISKSISGENHPMYGKKHGDETRSRMQESAKNRLPITEETRHKLSNATSGENNPMFGKDFSEVHRKKMSKAASKWYVVTKPDGVEEVIQNLLEYCTNNGLNHSSMCGVASGRYKHHRGYICNKYICEKGNV
jgi:hypothetical protein